MANLTNYTAKHLKVHFGTKKSVFDTCKCYSNGVRLLYYNYCTKIDLLKNNPVPKFERKAFSQTTKTFIIYI